MTILDGQSEVPSVKFQPKETHSKKNIFSRLLGNKPSEEEISIERYRQGQFEAIRRLREQLQLKMGGSGKGWGEKAELLREYINSIVKLDEEYPSLPDSAQLQGYIVDGKSFDFWTNPGLRITPEGIDDHDWVNERHKVVVNKREVFEESREFIAQILSQQLPDLNITRKVAAYMASVAKTKTMEKYRKAGLTGVYSQLLLQTFGIRSQTLVCGKEIFNPGSRETATFIHSCNLVLLGAERYLLDPQDLNSSLMIYVSEADFKDMQSPSFRKTLDRGDGTKVTYKSLPKKE